MLLVLQLLHQDNTPAGARRQTWEKRTWYLYFQKIHIMFCSPSTQSCRLLGFAASHVQGCSKPFPPALGLSSSPSCLSDANPLCRLFNQWATLPCCKQQPTRLPEIRRHCTPARRSRRHRQGNKRRDLLGDSSVLLAGLEGICFEAVFTCL